MWKAWRFSPNKIKALKNFSFPTTILEEKRRSKKETQDENIIVSDIAMNIKSIIANIDDASYIISNDENNGNIFTFPDDSDSLDNLTE